MPMPAGLFGLHVVLGDRVQSPSALYRCRCGYEVREQGPADLVRVFVEESPSAHRAVCRLEVKEQR